MGRSAFVCDRYRRFSPDAVHTVDGVLFGACGLLALARARGLAGLALGALLVMAAAATKQSLFFLVSIGIAQVAWVRGRRDAAVVAAICGGLAAVAAGLLAGTGLLGECLSQMSSVSRAGSLFGAGMIAYVKPFVYYAIPTIAASSLSIADSPSCADGLLFGRGSLTPYSAES